MVQTVYPNPTSGKFCISFVSETGNHSFKVKVRSLTGVLVTETVLHAKKICDIDISHSSSGLYVVTVEDRGKVVFGTKVMKIDY